MLTGEGAAMLVTSDTFSFMTKNLHRPPPTARLPSIVNSDRVQEDYDGDDQDDEDDKQGEDDDDEQGEDDE